MRSIARACVHDVVTELREESKLEQSSVLMIEVCEESKWEKQSCGDVAEWCNMRSVVQVACGRSKKMSQRSWSE